MRSQSSRTALVRGVEQLPGGDVALVPGGADVAVEGVVDVGQPRELGEQRDRNREVEGARLVALGFLDLDLESLDVPKLPTRSPPGRQAESEDHDHEEPEDDGPCFLVHRAYFSSTSNPCCLC